MADTVAVRTLIDDDSQIGVLLTSVSDGTGEAAVTKITKANVAKTWDPVNRVRLTPVALDLMKAEWTVTGFTKVQLLWDATTDDVIFTTGPAYGRFDLTGRGVIVGDSIRTSYAQDPISSGNTGNINLTSVGATGSTYSIVLFFRKRVA